mmetsp:Transcript_46261/g.121335  ORF Transcript_46261/g.121335 Transcript_46261/m.121335 type:complete len:121 (-) Transcript_46261:1269-1631(-)
MCRCHRCGHGCTGREPSALYRPCFAILFLLFAFLFLEVTTEASPASELLESGSMLNVVVVDRSSQRLALLISLPEPLSPNMQLLQVCGGIITTFKSLHEMLLAAQCLAVFLVLLLSEFAR